MREEAEVRIQRVCLPSLIASTPPPPPLLRATKHQREKIQLLAQRIDKRKEASAFTVMPLALALPLLLLMHASCFFAFPTFSSSSPHSPSPSAAPLRYPPTDNSWTRPSPSPVLSASQPWEGIAQGKSTPLPSKL
jgi:hypothetical protein